MNTEDRELVVCTSPSQNLVVDRHLQGSMCLWLAEYKESISQVSWVNKATGGGGSLQYSISYSQ